MGRGRGWDQGRAAEPASRMLRRFLFIECTKSDKASLRPLAQAAPKDTRCRRERMACQPSPPGGPGGAQRASPGWPLLRGYCRPAPAGTHRPPPVRAHRRGRPPGLRPRVGKPAGKDGPGRGTRTPGRGAGHPGSCPARSGPASRADPCRSRSRRRPSVAVPQAPTRFPSFGVFWPGNSVPSGR